MIHPRHQLRKAFSMVPAELRRIAEQALTVCAKMDILLILDRGVEGLLTPCGCGPQTVLFLEP